MFIFFRKLKNEMICLAALDYFLETLSFSYNHYLQMDGNIIGFSYASIKTQGDSDTCPNYYDWCRLKYE